MMIFHTTRQAGRAAFLLKKSPASRARYFGSDASSVLRDRRLAGRRRFYKNVGVELLDHTPWDSETSSTSANVVESPISAGVDGSQSATGVEHLSQDSTELRQHYLTPRKPPLQIHGKDDTSLSPSTVFSTAQQRTNEWYGVTLDGRLIQTPMGQPLAVPSALWAAQIAAEWDAVDGVLQPTQMPCMTLTCTVLDQTAHHPDIYQQQVTKFVPTDTICYWADPQEDRILHQRQEEAWRRIHDRVEQVTGTTLATVSGAEQGMIVTRSSGASPTIGLPHDPVLLEYATEFCFTLDAWHLTALQSLAVEAKSFWLAWALLTQQYYFNHDEADDDLPLIFQEVADAVHASRVEEEFQISMWGMVEGQHDYDRLNTSVNISSALLLVNSLATDCKL